MNIGNEQITKKYTGDKDNELSEIDSYETDYEKLEHISKILEDDYKDEYEKAINKYIANHTEYTDIILEDLNFEADNDDTFLINVILKDEGDRGGVPIRKEELSQYTKDVVTEISKEDNYIYIRDSLRTVKVSGINIKWLMPELESKEDMAARYLYIIERYSGDSLELISENYAKDIYF